MTIKIYKDVEQGSPEWLAMRCGVLTASEMKHIITPKYKIANNAKTKMHVFELLAQRLTHYVEPSYIGDDMLRGMEDEFKARDIYNGSFHDVKEVGFITNDKWGFTLGYSPDGLVDANGLIEIKSRRQKYQIQTITDWVVPEEHDIQVQTALLVSEREWIDYVQYCGGMPMVVIRVYPDLVKQQAILDASSAFEASIREKFDIYHTRLKTSAGDLIETKREIEEEITL